MCLGNLSSPWILSGVRGGAGAGAEADESWPHPGGSQHSWKTFLLLHPCAAGSPGGETEAQTSEVALPRARPGLGLSLHGRLPSPWCLWTDVPLPETSDICLLCHGNFSRSLWGVPVLGLGH